MNARARVTACNESIRTGFKRKFRWVWVMFKCINKLICYFTTCHTDFVRQLMFTFSIISKHNYGENSWNPNGKQCSVFKEATVWVDATAYVVQCRLVEAKVWVVPIWTLSQGITGALCISGVTATKETSWLLSEFPWVGGSINMKTTENELGAILPWCLQTYSQLYCQ